MKDITFHYTNEQMVKDLLAITPISQYNTAIQFKHQVVNHSKGQYKKGADAHTNSIEGFWSTLKRGAYGIYHHVSKKHLQHYVNEFAFRYNNRNNEFIFDKLVGATILA